MKTILSVILLFGGVACCQLSCTEVKSKSINTGKEEEVTSQPIVSMTDPRDGEVYAVVNIGKQIWMAENLRYNAPGSMLNPDNPSTIYGRLYDGISAQTACPDGWRLPSDAEWNEMEMALGMPAADTAKTYWRGEHGAMMKSVTGWDYGENGTNSSGFNGFPAGYYFSGTHGGEVGMDGIGHSGGYWASAEGDRAWIRFLGAPLAGVNRFDDDISNGFAIGCRCVRD